MCIPNHTDFLPNGYLYIHYMCMWPCNWLFQHYNANVICIILKWSLCKYILYDISEVNEIERVCLLPVPSTHLLHLLMTGTLIISYGLKNQPLLKLWCFEDFGMYTPLRIWNVYYSIAILSKICL